MIKIIDAKLNHKQTKQNKKLQEAKGLIIGEHTVDVFSDEEKAAEFIYHLQRLTSWLAARFISQDEE